ncbi:MAG: hypothetical protein QOF60_3155, partial [Actinomycetota bacterium]|nr:hypothetical protein [Actinomycetota bacterium]
MRRKHAALVSMVAAVVLATGLVPLPLPLSRPAAASPPSSDYRDAVLADSPAGYWRLGEASGTTAVDASGHARNGTISAGVTLGVAGAFEAGSNAAMSFDGSTGIATSYTPTVAAFSAEAWVKTSGAAGSVAFPIVQSRGSGASKSLTLSRDPSGEVNFVLDTDGVMVGVKSVGRINDGAWHHVLGTWAAPSGTVVLPAQFRLYVDGLPAGVTNQNSCFSSCSITSPFAGAVLKIARHDVWASTFPGTIDEVAVFESALSPSRARAHYVASGRSPARYQDAVSADAPFGYWRLDELAGTVAADSSGNGRNGTYVGAVALGAAGLIPTEGTNGAAGFTGGHVDLGTLNLSLAAVTLEAWVKPQTFGASSPYIDSIVGTETVDDNNALLLRLGYDGLTSRRGRPDFVTTTRVGSPSTEAKAPSAVRGPGVVHHVVGVFDNPTLTVYVDGVRVATATASVSDGHALGNAAYWIAGNPLFGRYFDGVVDEVAIYDHALSADRVAAHYAASGNRPAVASAQTRGWSLFGRPTTTRRADPVDTATGAFVDQTTDLAVPGQGVPFSFTRTYNSNDATVGPLGTGWSHSLGTSLSVAGTGVVTVRTGDGADLVFTPDAGGAYLPPPAVTASLTTVTGGYDLATADQVHNRFDTSGRLLSIKDRAGLGVTLAYDGSGRLATATDAAARVFTFSYDAGGKLVGVAAPVADGRSVSYGYTGNLLTSVTDVRGGTTAYAYDASDRLRQVTDPEGNLQVRNTFDAAGRVIEQLDPLGGATTFAWDAATETSTVTDPRGKTWVDRYAGNVLVGTTEPAGSSSVGFDGSLNPVSATDANGRSWSATYDSRGNVVSRTAPAPLSYVESWTYDAAGNPLTYTDGRGNTTTYGYDGSGRLTSTTWPGGAVEGRTYDAAGRLATVTDARSNATTYAYDAVGNLGSVTTAGGSVTSWTYDAGGRPLTRTSPRGWATTWTYDAAGNVLTETDALGHTTTSTYDGNGLLTTRIDAAGRTTAYAYNAALELTSTTAPGGLVTTNTYDARGQLSSVVSPSGAKTTYEYDDAGRTVAMVEPRGNLAGAVPADYRWTYGYDAVGNQTSVTDPLGHSTVSTFDAVNRVVSATDANGHSTGYGYDANSNRVSTTNHLGQTTASAFDARNRLSSTTNPLGKTWAHGYDANGNLTSSTTPLGFVTTRSYDADNRLTAVVDPLGNVSGGVPADHDTVYGYDADGNVVSETDPLGVATGFGFDRVGNRVTRTDG